MLLGALADLLDNPSEIKQMIESAGIPGIEVMVHSKEMNHIRGNKVEVLVHGQPEGHHHGHSHSHRSLAGVLDIINGLKIPDSVKHHATKIYEDIAKAESEAHGTSVGEVHFHEVGMLDAIADVVGSCLLIHELAPDMIVSSPLRTGYGYVDCAHGKLPIPAPATALLLRGVPNYAGDLEGEFTTPTGAAIIGHFAEDYGQRPRMTIQKIGMGMGDREFSIPNMVRAFIGDSEEGLFEIYEINCNIDDMTPEDLGPMIDRLLDEGARDATLTPMIMKKGRPGYRLTCLCRQADKEKLAKLILANTSTIGLRIWKAERFEMSSRMEVCHTEYGDIRIKVSEGYGISKWKPEHDDIVKASEKYGVSLRKVRESIRFEPKTKE
jgi:uncharacterized protein (TIGR00299 family) protein